MRDHYGRNIDYMRISITDRCNLQCRYCMPAPIPLTPMNNILTFEEIRDICEAAVLCGIRKIKLTGGEPLVRLGCPDLIGKIKHIKGIEHVTLTTNGVLLEQYLEQMVRNGLDGINISLDTLNAQTYEAITGRDELVRVKSGIKAALSLGVPVKTNSVLLSGVNDTQWQPLLELAKEERIDVRFIEMMPIGYGKEYKTISNDELYRAIRVRYPLIEKDYAVHGNGPARYYRIPGFKGSIGFISAIHNHFCSDCNRIRLTSMGKIKPCLCYGNSIDLRPLLLIQNKIDKRRALIREIQRAIDKKPQKHCFEAAEQVTEGHQMAQIGG